MTTHSSILAWKIPWTEEPMGHSPWGRKESGMTERLNTASRTPWAPAGRMATLQLSTCGPNTCTPGQALCPLAHLILMSAMGCGCCCYSHLADEKTEFRQGRKLTQGTTADELRVRI